MANGENWDLAQNGPAVPTASRVVSPVSGYVFDIKKYAIHDGPGIRTTVFLKGCPLRCRWCHNPESWTATPELSLRRNRCVRCGRCVELCPEGAISLLETAPRTDPQKCVLCGTCVAGCLADAREIIGRRMTPAEVMAEVGKDVIFYDESGGGVTFSGGEPLMQPEFLLALLNRCRAAGIHTAVDTTCYAEPDVIRRVAQVTNLFLCDVKHMDSERHERYTDVDNEKILENIKMLAEAGENIAIRIPVIPDFNDDAANIEKTARFLQSLPGVRRVDILPYNRGGLAKSIRLNGDVETMQTEPPNDDRMTEIAGTFRDCGFEVKIGG